MTSWMHTLSQCNLPNQLVRHASGNGLALPRDQGYPVKLTQAFVNTSREALAPERRAARSSRPCVGGWPLRASGKPGGGVLDRPTTAPPLLDPDQDVRKVRQKKKPRFYKVMLHNDSVNRREYVVRVLLKVVKGLTVEDAVNVMQHAHMYGSGCVIACAQEEAERYCEGLRSNGLIATVEPAGYGSGDGGEPTP